jgi:hypothetical protein
MNRQVVKTAKSPSAATFGVTRSEQACDRQQGLRRYVIECDPEA